MHDVLIVPFTESSMTRAAFAIFTLVLGLQRLTYSTGDGGLLPWLCLVATHAFETVFWWYVAIDMGYLNGTTVPDLFLKLVTQRTKADIHVFVLLFFVPCIAIICTFAGPSSAKATAENKKKS